MENENNQNEVVKEQPVKTKKSKLPVIIIVLVLLAAAVFPCLYFFTDIFKSKTQVFAEKLTSKQSIRKQIEESNKLMERMEKEPYKSETKITLDIGEGLNYLAQSYVGLDLSKFEINETSQSDTEAVESNIAIKYNNKNIIALDLLKKDNLIGLRVKDLYSKYFTVENDNLKSLVRNFGVEDTSSVPNKLVTSEEIRKAITITEKDMDKIESKYSKVISDSIKSKEVTEEKDVEVSFVVNGETKKLNTKKSKITLNEKEALELVIDIVKELKDDEDTLKLIVDNYDNLVKVYEDAGYDIYFDELKVSDLKDGLKDLQEQLKDELEDYKDKSNSDLEKMDIVLYDYKNEIVKTSILVSDVEISLISYSEGDEDYLEVSFVDSSYSQSQVITIYVYEKSKEEGKKITSDAVIGVKYNSEVDAKIKLNQTIDFGADVKITDLTSSNSLSLNNASTSQLENVVTEIEKNAQTYAMKLYLSFPQEIDKISKLMMNSNSNSEVNYDYLDDSSDFDDLNSSNSFSLDSLSKKGDYFVNNNNDDLFSSVDF